jgi:hypothetical protein
VSYFGDISQYTGRNVLLSLLPLPKESAVGLMLNGKPEIKAQRLDPMWISPDGAQIALVITPNARTPSVLSVNGKVIPDTNGLMIRKVYFSPDGKRWAALCQTKLGRSFMIVDGKKKGEYASIPSDIVCAPYQNRWKYISSSLPGQIHEEPVVPGFTADSSKFVYVANAASQQFLVVDDSESNGFDGTLTLQPVLSPTANRFGLIAVARGGIQHVIVDGKDTAYDAFAPAPNRITTLGFSPKSTHYAFAKGNVVYLDGVAQPGAGAGEYVFSPDETHIAYAGILSDVQWVIVDGKEFLQRPVQVGHIFFSPDSQHIYWTSNRGLPGTRDSTLLFVDGKPGPHFTAPINGRPMAFAFEPNGELVFVALVDGNPRRIHVTSDTSLPAVLAAAPAAQ